ncbi:MAG: cell surface protein [Prevotellaceae bacterium]|jgi:hypothetical protein|nr:cell surface protein [Prevotellaceae bacterium]
MKHRLFSTFVIAIAALLSSCSDDDNNDEPNFMTGKLEVLEYRPAPGQFINEGMTATTQQEADTWAQQRLDNGHYVSLGSFGGYITLQMPKIIKNRNGYDFGIVGNPFDGSSEPGIVWVSEDVNENGITDDPWYELKGGDESTRGYEVTYQKTTEPGDVPWSDNENNSGVINHLLQYHSQNYYPAWITDNSYTLRGTKLEPRTVVGNDGIWKNLPFSKGYADNWGDDKVLDGNNSYLYNRLDLDDAIDQSGNSVSLQQIHFIKVQSAILHNVPSIGELSTEVYGVKVF